MFQEMCFIRCHLKALHYPQSESLTQRPWLVELAVTMETFTAGAKVMPLITAAAELDRWAQNRQDGPLVEMRTSVQMV